LEEIGQPGTSSATPDAPRGVFKVSIDDKGRLKLPAAITEYLQGLGENKVFITTLDVKEVRIYPLSVWRRTERLLEEPGEDFAFRQDLAMIASSYGKDDELDQQGRLTLPGDLRRELGLEKDEARLRWYQGHLKLVSGQEHERRLEAAKANLDFKLKALQVKGL
jgi:DNA-binding transcriptional regulator/RsmH inhibitor MraZ